MHVALALVLSILIGISLGLLGSGGSILAVPILVYVAHIKAKVAVMMSLAIVGATSLLASLMPRMTGNVDLVTAALFSTTGIAGAFLGARLTAFVSDRILMLLFACLMIMAGALMYVRSGSRQAEDAHDRERKTPSLLVSGLATGVVTGFLGIGGGFLVIPALTIMGGLPIRLAIGTSLVVITLNSLAGFVAHLMAGWGGQMLDYGLIAAFTGCAVSGAVLGQKLSVKIRASHLGRVFAVLIVLIGLAVASANLLSTQMPQAGIGMQGVT